MTTEEKINNAKSFCKKMRIQLVRGLPISTRFKKEVVEEIFEFVPRDDDVIIATYPKTGSTWLSYIVVQILTIGESFPTFNDMMTEVVPYLEMTGVSVLESIKTKPRVYNHHLPYNLVKKNPNSKVIYVYRKPEDTLISYYFFLSGLYNEAFDLDDFLENFLSGNIGYGGYFENILSYLEHKNDENLLFVSYEKLLLNRREEILKIAEFLGAEYYKNLVRDETTLNKIITQTSFNYMKQNLSKESSDKEVGEDGLSVTSFFRKGKSGDGKQRLSENQLQRIREIAEELLKGTDVLKEWYED